MHSHLASFYSLGKLIIIILDIFISQLTKTLLVTTLWIVIIRQKKPRLGSGAFKNLK